jgi:hypothetical protein
VVWQSVAPFGPGVKRRLLFLVDLSVEADMI